MNDLIEVAILVFGPRWKRALSRQIGISRVQLWRYEKGMAPLPGAAAEKIKVALRMHLEIKRDQISRTIATLDSGCSS